MREYCVLWKADEGERTQQEIAELAGLDKSTLVVTLDKLEAAGSWSGGCPTSTVGPGWSA